MILPQRPAPDEEAEMQRSKVMDGFTEIHDSDKITTIQGLAILGSSSLFAMSTHGVRWLVWFLAVSGSSLAIQESTSSGLADVALPELRTARM